MSFAVDRNTPVFFLSETWLTEGRNSVTAAIKTYGYKIIHEIRDCGKTGKQRGGGVAIIHKVNLNFTKVHIDSDFSTAEVVSAKIKLSTGELLLCCCVYRTNNISDTFFQEFDEFLSTAFAKYSNILLCGDLNIHLDNPYCPNARKFEELISSHGLNQAVVDPTHKSGHTLDVVITSHKVVNEKSVTVEPEVSQAFPGCDHFPISFSFKKLALITSLTKKEISFRNIKKIDQDLFHSHLQKIIEVPDSSSSSFSMAISTFNYSCNLLLNNHAPTLSKSINDCPSTPWFDGEYKSLRNLRRHAEKKWLKSKTEVDKIENRRAYTELRDDCNQLALEKKKKYYQEQFKSHNFSSKSLFNFVEKFTDKDNEVILPPNESIQQVADNFNSFFQEKIDTIRNKFKDTDFSKFSEEKFHGLSLDEFDPATTEEIYEILKDSELKTSTIDPLPASLIEENLESMLPYLCYLVNLSLSSGNIDGAKLAHVTPLIKDFNVDASILKNYRPISNLSFVGKLIERVVLRRLNKHLDKHNLNITNQSGYRKFFSTETLLVKIVDDLMIAVDENKATVVMLLDLSAAFDTVDHGKLINILYHEIGITGTALNWFRSFITGRCQQIKIGSAQSEVIVIKFGVPQGSVLGPILFNLYIRSIYATVQNLKFSIHGYADDHQIYKSFNPDDQYSILVNDIPQCFYQIEKWMAAHFLQLNPGKTEIIIFGSPKVLSHISIHGSFLMHSTCLRFSPVVKNLGFRLDSNLLLNKQISNLKSVCCNKLRAIAKMKPFLNTKQVTMLVQSTVIASLDYCNALYLGCSSNILKQLQNIQNRACRIIFGLKRRDSVSPYLKSLHWLKVEQRIQFKILLLTHKCLHDRAPSYLSDSIHKIDIPHSRGPSLHVPSKINSRAFSSAGPIMWNSLPIEIRGISDINVFKRNLKTYLFKISYGNDLL